MSYTIAKRLPIELKHVLDVSLNSYLTPSATNQYWTVDSGNLHVLGCGATDMAKVLYYKKHADIVAGGGSSTVVYDNAFTVGADGVTITNFTGVLASHVGGTLVGSDGNSALFSRVITSYISPTSFTIASAVGAGAGSGYIVPATSTSDTLVPSPYFDMILDYAMIESLKEKPQTPEVLAQTKVIQDSIMSRLSKLQSNSVLKQD